MLKEYSGNEFIQGIQTECDERLYLDIKLHFFRLNF